MSKLIKFKQGIYQNPTKFLVNGQDTDIKPNFGTVIQEGTPYTATNFNEITRQITYTVKDTSTSANTFVAALEGLEANDLTSNLKLIMIPNTTNTGSSTINIQGLGAKPLRKRGNVNLVSGDIVKNQQAIISFNETYNCFEVINPQYIESDIISTIDPTPDNKNYTVGKTWYNSTTGNMFKFKGLDATNNGIWSIFNKDGFIMKKTEQTAPPSPGVTDIAFDRATVTGTTNTEVSLDKTTWYDSPYTFTNLTEKTQYTAYARRKETDTQNASPASTGTQFTTPPEAFLYAFEVDESNLNPATAVTYIGQNQSFTPAKVTNGIADYGSWEDFLKKISYRVIVKDGVEQYRVQYDNPTKKLDGSNAILTGADGDLFTKFIHIWRKYTKTTNGYRIELSDKPFTGAKSLTNELENGYNQFNNPIMIMLQDLYLLTFKNRDSQTALGRGYVDSNATFANTGGTNSKGYIYGETTGKLQMCFLGIEDLWGNKYQWVDGLVSDSSYNILTGTKSFNDTGSGYTKFTTGVTSSLSGYAKTVQGGDAGYVLADTAGSTSTGYCDFGALGSGRVAFFGGGRSAGDDAGVFFVRLAYSASYSDPYYGARLCFKNTEGVYVGNYLGFVEGSKLRSISEKEPTGDKTIGAFRIHAQNNNTDAPGAKKYGFIIDQNNSNPLSSVTYTDNAIGMTPMQYNVTGNHGYGSWKNFIQNELQAKPCLLKGGVVQYYLNPENYTKKSDGTTADIASGNDGDVMIEIPTVWWKLTDLGNKKIQVQVSMMKFDGSIAPAHTVGTTVRDKIYISAYEGSEIGGKLRSLSGKSVSTSKTISQFRTLSQSNGYGYQQYLYYQNLMLQILYILLYKNLDSQTALGHGLVNSSSFADTGTTNSKGLFYGLRTSAVLKFLGIENWYGNINKFLDGAFYSASNEVKLSNQTTFNDTGSGSYYISYGVIARPSTGGYITVCVGNNNTAFIPTQTSGSSTTYYCDSTEGSGSLFVYGGNRSSSQQAGAFMIMPIATSGYSQNDTTSRLSYIGG